jgi:hypothetical protein
LFTKRLDRGHCVWPMTETGRVSLTPAQLSMLLTAPSNLPDDPATLHLIPRAALAEIERLQLQLAALRRNRFGRRSEKLDDEQVQRGLEDLEQSVAEQQAGLDAAAAEPSAPESSVPEPKTAPASPRTKPAKRNRGALPAHLSRIEVIVDVEDKACPCCGGTTHVKACPREGGGRRCRGNVGLRAGSAAGESDPPAEAWLPGLRRRGRSGARAGPAD